MWLTLSENFTGCHSKAYFMNSNWDKHLSQCLTFEKLICQYCFFRFCHFAALCSSLENDAETNNDTSKCFIFKTLKTLMRTTWLSGCCRLSFLDDMLTRLALFTTRRSGNTCQMSQKVQYWSFSLHCQTLWGRWKKQVMDWMKKSVGNCKKISN